MIAINLDKRIVTITKRVSIDRLLRWQLSYFNDPFMSKYPPIFSITLKCDKIQVVFDRFWKVDNWELVEGIDDFFKKKIDGKSYLPRVEYSS